jgi:hypothetical protein
MELEEFEKKKSEMFAEEQRLMDELKAHHDRMFQFFMDARENGFVWEKTENRWYKE